MSATTRSPNINTTTTTTTTTTITTTITTTKSPLHNFTLPPTLKWANQRQLRCTKTPSFSSSSLPPPSPNTNTNTNINDEDHITDNNNSNCETPPPTNATTATATATTTAAACASSAGGKRLRSNGFETRYRRRGERGTERVKFCVELSKDEVDFDFLSFIGTKPPRKPKRRPRLLQRQIDMICPGLWLTEITADRYGVSDFGDFRKIKG